MSNTEAEASDEEEGTNQDLPSEPETAIKTEAQIDIEIDEKTKTILSKKYGYEIGKKLGAGSYGEVRTSRLHLFVHQNYWYILFLFRCSLQPMKL